MEVQTFTYKLTGSKYYLPGVFGEEMDHHVQGLLRAGWEPMNGANDTGHVKLGQTIGMAAMTGGLSLLFGASRTAPTITLTFRKG